MRAIAWTLAGFVLSLGGLSAAAQTADCSHAKTDVEKALCADPAAAAADKAMAAAYNALRDKLQGKDRDALLRSQRHWITTRGADCEAGKPGFAACVAADADRRRAFLEGRAEAGTGAAMQPVIVVRPGRKGAYEIDVEVLRFPDPQTPGEKTFNAAIDKLLKDIPADTKDIDADQTYSHYVSMRMSYASPRLLSARFEGYDYEGGAHGMAPSWGLSVDRQSGRKLAFADAFDKAAQDRLNQECLKQILVQKKERMDETPAGEDLASLKKNLATDLGELGNWNFSATGAEIVFNQYELGSYAEGRYACTMPLALLKSLAKPGFPLPD